MTQTLPDYAEATRHLPRRRPRRVLHRDLREAAAQVGIDPVVAETTPHDDLAAVIRLAPMLRIVDDVEVSESWVDAMLADGFSIDECASVATYARGELVEAAFASGADQTPWDHFDGPDAA